MRISLLLPLLLLGGLPTPVQAQPHQGFADVEKIRSLLAKPERDLDYAQTKLTIDKMIQPSISINATRNQLDAMAQEIKAMAGPSPTPIVLKNTLRLYLYQAGPWNNNQAFLYDFNDPLGTKISNKLLPNYLASKRGNCITMPFLFIILGDKLGLKVAASTAPL